MGESLSDNPDEQIIERTVDTDTEKPNYYVLETIADAEGVDMTELPPMYERIDHVLDELFDDPPDAESQVEVTFSYHGYRITVRQGGRLVIRKLDDDLLDS